MDTKVQSLLKDINKKFGAEVATIGKEYKFDRIPFTSPKLNYMTYGGLPMGRVVEFFGSENGGKSTTALDICANAQKKFKDNGRLVAYFDIENSLEPAWAEKFGVDMEKMVVISPSSPSAEKILDSVKDIVESDMFGLIVVDSIPAMVSDSMVDESLDKKSYGGISAVLSRFSSLAMTACAQHNCLIIAINQLRDNLNSMYGGTTTPGGKAWKYACTLRMKFQHGPFIDGDGKELSNNNASNPFGNIINVSLEKTKCCPPNRRQGHYTLRYDTGIDYVSDFIDIALLYGCIVQGGAWYSVIDKETGEVMKVDNTDLKFQGKAKLVEMLKTNDELYKTLYDKIKPYIEGDAE